MSYDAAHEESWFVTIFLIMQIAFSGDSYSRPF